MKPLGIYPGQRRNRQKTIDRESKFLEESKQIQEIFKNIKGIVESWEMQSYPAAPDPDLYIEKIEEKIKEYWKIGNRQSNTGLKN